MLLEQVADLVAADVHAGKDEVVGGLAAQLLDELAEVALHHAVTVRLHGLVEVDLLAGHALALDDGLRPGRPQKPQHDLPGLVGVAGPVHLPAVGLEGCGEPREEFVEPVDGRPLGEAGGVAGLLPVAVAGLLCVAGGVVAAERLADEGPVARVADVLGRVVEELFLRQPRVGGLGGGVGRGAGGMGCHASAPASTSARWIVRGRFPCRVSQPSSCSWQDGSLDTM